MLCVTITIVMSWQISAIVSSTTPVEIGSSAEHGSSISRTCGWIANERAMQRRCCWPPDSVIPPSFSRSFTSFQSPARVRHCSTSALLSPAGVRDSFSPASTFCLIDIEGNGFGFWKTMPMRMRTWVALSSLP